VDGGAGKGYGFGVDEYEWGVRWTGLNKMVGDSRGLLSNREVE